MSAYSSVMSNIIRKSLSDARAWLLSKPYPERKLAELTGVDNRTFRYASKPSWDPRASTLAAIVDAMNAPADSAVSVPQNISRGQETAQDAEKANVEGLKSHCCANDAPPEAA